MKELAAILSLGAVVTAGPNAAAQQAPLAIVVADSVSLHSTPEADAPAVRFVAATLQFEILAASGDSAWLKVRIGEQKGYQLDHSDEYWVRSRDVALPRSTRSRVDVDVSVLEVPTGQYGRRITTEEFLSAGGVVPGSFYVSARYVTRVPSPSCRPPFSACAMIYDPERYSFGLPGDRPEAQRPLFDRLYADSTVRVRYEITGERPIRSVHERLVVARVLMGDAGCYAEDYRGTQVSVARDSVRAAASRRFVSDAVVSPEMLFVGEGEAQVQYVNLMWVLQPTYEDGTQEEIVRRIQIWWPRCA